MCPPAPVDITKFWTEEEIFKSLEEFKSGSPLPAYVTADVNPYQFKPSNLPEGIWYFCSEVNKKAQHGFWKATEEACDIYSNSAMTGWRVTLEYYEGLAPHGQRTNWVMQEYWITKRELCQNSKPKVSDSLCRVYLSDEESPSFELPPEHDLADISNTNPVNCVPTTAPNADSNTVQLSKSESLEKNMFNETRCQALAERSPRHHPLENLAECDYISNGDYLELIDLADPDSNSSSSVGSSFRTFTSEEYFDSVALLRELDAEIKDQNEKCASFKFIHSSTVKPKEVVMLPAIVGSLSSDSGSKSPTEGTHKGDYVNEATSNSPNIVASSSSSSNGSFKEEKKGLVGRMKKVKNKYLCFMSL